MKKITKKMKVKVTPLIIMFLSLFFALVLAVSFCFAAISSITTMVRAESCPAKAMCLMEANSGRVLKEKNSSSHLAMASTTKIMTAITAIEHCDDLDEFFEVSPKAVGISGTSLYLKEGETHSIRNLLYGLMLTSGNDASVAIGERIGGRVEHFVDLMNFTAHRLGASNTHFENTHGLDENGHYTSAADLAKITSYALKNPVFRDIVSTQSKKITSGEGKERYLCNKNKLLRTFDGAIGVKTGFTDDAGRCLVSAAERDGMTLVCVVLNCGPMFEECAKQMEEAFKTYQMEDLTKMVTFPKTIMVEDGEKTEVCVGHKEKFLYPLKEGEKQKIQTSVTLEPKLKPVLEEGQKVGGFSISMSNSLLFSGEIVTMEKVKARRLSQRFFDIIKEW